MKHYEIKITGSGTSEELIKSLHSIANDLKSEDICNYEDRVLYMDIYEVDPVDED